MRVLVVGGGIAGLCAAIALGKAGHAVSVVELHGRVDGAVIAITNRAVDALEELGVLNEVAAVGFVIGGTESIFSRIFDGAGRPLQIPEPAPRTDTRLPASISLLRPDFARILTAAAMAVGTTVRVGLSVAAIRDRGETVRVKFDDMSEEDYDLVVGADGIHSSIRQLAFPEAPEPEYTGHMSFRWLVKNGPTGDAGPYTLPDNSMIMTTRLPGNLLYLSTGVDMERRHVPAAEARALLRRALARFSAPLMAALVDRIDDEQDLLMRPYDWLLVPAPWHRGRIVLVGDAVHATTAHLASGGSLAIEDGVVLAQELARPGSLADRLGRYSTRRFARAAMVVEASVALLRLQQAKADRVASASLRAQTVSALREPY